MIANDFTQINTDGKGVSCINGVDAELVSVFTYYCDKGFNTESGGTIRALTVQTHTENTVLQQV